MRIAGHQFWWYGGAIQRKGGDHIEREPFIAHVNAMLRRLRPDSVRAVYMIVKELDQLQASENRVS